MTWKAGIILALGFVAASSAATAGWVLGLILTVLLIGGLVYWGVAGVLKGDRALTNLSQPGPRGEATAKCEKHGHKLDPSRTTCPIDGSRVVR